ncbi:MAG: ATP-binding cassette domain-containing protein [Candidatus Heimdallarchaeota archaeon]|nr:MAG: ATP-binding cassette domain-containing protein [Candidatus Heimdallarchaeota archaeon]
MSSNSNSEIPVAVEARNITKEFSIGSTKITILNELDFSCYENEFIIISGPSGSGKSTFLSIIGGLTSVDQGSVRVLNHQLNTMTEEALAIFRSVYVGFVFQTGHLIDSLTVLENILLPVELSQREDSENKYQERAWELMEEFKLSERADSLPAMISGGEYQRTAFIRALILDPDILLIDEPTSNQDTQTTKIISDKLHRLKGKKNLIVITHEKKLFPLADKIYVPRDGKLSPYEMD